jgi:outer membrane protein OmpA-like peptidoglycan-associated protein
MTRTCSPFMLAAVALAVQGCSSTPERVAELDSARTLVSQVEGSPRAGVAAADISEARHALDRANDLSERGQDVDDIRFEATVALRNAEIANEKILTAQAKGDFEKATAERQQVLLEARASEARLAEERALRMEQEMKDLQARQTDRGMVLTLGDVLFDTGKATLKSGAYVTMDRLAKVLNESKDRHVVIEGHTDSTGSDETNMMLSQQRALAVQSALMQRGVSGSQITAVGKGESVPVASNGDAAGRQQNRRVELIFSQERSRVASDVE